MITLSQSSLFTTPLQVPVAIQSPDAVDPSVFTVQFAFTPYSYPVIQPDAGDWHNGIWVTFPGPSFWAQISVGPAGVALAAGRWSGWARVMASPDVPGSQCFLLQITS